MKDRELLEAAARAAGIEIGDYLDPIDRKYSGALGIWIQAGYGEMGRWWNPLQNGDHAFQLVVKLGLSVEVDNGDHVTRVLNCLGGELSRELHHEGGQMCSTYRAIVRAASSIGRSGERGEEA